MLRFSNYLQEAYSFFPKTEEEISSKLADWPHESVADTIALFNYLKGKGELEKPNQEPPEHINFI